MGFFCQRLDRNAVLDVWLINENETLKKNRMAKLELWFAMAR